MNLVEQITNKFKNFPKSAKPSSLEWTVLAAIIQHSASSSECCKVVAIATGTKCIGQSKLNGTGFLLNDSHAEVLARRAFLRYLYHELKRSDGKSIFTWNVEQATFELEASISFHFFSTKAPCGDACIIEETDGVGVAKRRKVEQTGDVDLGDVLRSLYSDGNAIFTGAKLIGDESDVMQQTTGAVRTKPGRGDRTLSMSCSDKLAKWNVLGVQGALLDTLLARPIYFETLSFGCDSNQKALERAIYGRWQNKHFLDAKFEPRKPDILICSLKDMQLFDFVQSANKQPSPSCVVWSDLPAEFKPFEISVNGLRQGVTKKNLNTPQAALKVSKYWLRLNYIDLLRTQPLVMQRLNIDAASNLDSYTYASLKEKSTKYCQAWSQIKRKYFGQWTQKPSQLLRFSSAPQTVPEQLINATKLEAVS